MPKRFSTQTLEKFEAASASIPVRQIDRAFAGAEIRLGTDPGGPAGDRRARFRSYVASVDQSDSRQVNRLGVALRALIEEVAESKQDFLIKAAERDGFSFAAGVLKTADLSAIDDRARELHALAEDSPKKALGGAKALIESVCRSVLRVLDEPAPLKATDLAEIVKATLKVFQLEPSLRRALEHLSVVVSTICAERNLSRSSRHARLAVGAAVTLARFVAETCAQRSSSKKPLRIM